MLPSFSRNNHPDRCSGHAKRSSNIFVTQARCGKFSNFANQSFCKFGISLLFAPRNKVWASSRPMLITALKQFGVNPPSAFISNGRPSFCHSVSNIVLLGAEEKVRRIYTWPVVATMQNKNFWGLRRICQFIRDSVSAAWNKLSIDFDSELPISVLSCCWVKNPTRPKLWSVFGNRAVPINLAPKPFDVFRSHKQKHRRPAKALWAHLWPQLPSDGGNVLSSSAVFGYNGAAHMLPCSATPSTGFYPCL